MSVYISVCVCYVYVCYVYVVCMLCVYDSGKKSFYLIVEGRVYVEVWVVVMCMYVMCMLCVCCVCMTVGRSPSTRYQMGGCVYSGVIVVSSVV